VTGIVVAVTVAAITLTGYLLDRRDRSRAMIARLARDTQPLDERELWATDPIAGRVAADAAASPPTPPNLADPWPWRRRIAQWFRTRSGRHSRALPRPRSLWVHDDKAGQ
jgi:hypothetical protein